MTRLDDVAVTVEHSTGNVVPLLHEIRHALERLVDSGEPTMIDLRGIPLAPGEEDALESALGSGEVTKPSRPASNVAHGLPSSSRAATMRNGRAVWKARCSSGR